MQIEIWSDVVCPWCFIGKRRLEQAIAQLPADAQVEVIHRAFQLDPTATTSGETTAQHLAHKYGVTEEQALDMMSEVTEEAAKVGLSYDLEPTLHGNTRDAHRLLLWAQAQGTAQPLLDAMYSGYFEKGRSVFAADELLAFVGEAGLDREAAAGILDSDQFASDVTADQQLAAQFGARGVPFFVIDRKYGISGAQPAEVFAETLQRALEG